MQGLWISPSYSLALVVGIGVVSSLEPVHRTIRLREEARQAIQRDQASTQPATGLDHATDPAADPSRPDAPPPSSKKVPIVKATADCIWDRASAAGPQCAGDSREPDGFATTGPAPAGLPHRQWVLAELWIRRLSGPQPQFAHAPPMPFPCSGTPTQT